MSKEALIKLKLLLQNRVKTPLQQARQQLNSATDEMKDKLSSLKNHHVKTFKAMKDEIPGLGRALELVTNKYVLMGATVVGLGVGLYKATNMALDWQKGMAKVNVTAGLSKDKLGVLSNQLLNIGRKNVAPLEEVPEAFNKIVSAGVDTNQALQMLDPTLKAAKAGFTDVETVAKAGVNVMKSSGEDYNKVMDTLFATLNKGNAEFADVANYLPKVVPIAKQAGFALYETAGAFAFLTAQGQSAQASTTLLQNAFKSLSDPSRAANFKKIGVSIYDSMGKIRPLTSIVNDLSGSLAGLTDEQKAKKLASLGLDQEAAMAFAVMSQNVKELSSTIDYTKNSQGAMMQAYSDSMTATDQWAVTLNNVKFILIKIGQKFFPIIEAIGNAAKSVTDLLIPALSKVKTFISEYRTIFYSIGIAIVAMNAKLIIASTWTGILAAKTWLAATASAALSAAMNANWIGIIIIAIAALVGWIITVIRKFEGWGTVWNFVKTLLINGLKLYILSWKTGFVDMWYTVQIFWEKIKGFGQYIFEFFKNLGQAIKLALSGNFSEAKQMLTKKIVTKSEAEIKILEQKKQANTDAFKSEAMKMALETKKAYEDIKLTRKKTEESKQDSDSDSNETTNTDGSGTSSSTISGDSSETVTGSAKQIRNITVNIDSFNKGGINTENTVLKNMSADQISEWFNQQMLRAIRNVEMSY